MSTTFDKEVANPHAESSRTPNLSNLVRDIQARLQSYGVSVADMRSAGSLETDLIVPPLVAAGMDSRHLERLEGPIVARTIERPIKTELVSSNSSVCAVCPSGPFTIRRGTMPPPAC